MGYPVQLTFKSLFEGTTSQLNTLPNSIVEAVNKAQINIGIAPFAAHQGKIYPLEKMQEVINELENNIENLQIYLFGGGEQETKQIATMVQQHRHCISVPEHLKGFQQELILMNELDAMISMDSSNMHLASLVATPVVSVWGATHPFAGFMGWNQKQEYVVDHSMACRPCSIYGNKPCYRGDFACMQNIDPQQITQKVMAIINAQQGKETNN